MLSRPPPPPPPLSRNVITMDSCKCTVLFVDYSNRSLVCVCNINNKMRIQRCRVDRAIVWGYNDAWDHLPVSERPPAAVSVIYWRSSANHPLTRCPLWWRQYSVYFDNRSGRSDERWENASKNCLFVFVCVRVWMYVCMCMCKDTYSIWTRVCAYCLSL